MIQAWTPKTPKVTAFNSLGLSRWALGARHPIGVADVSIGKGADGRPTLRTGPVYLYYTDDPVLAADTGSLPRQPEATCA